MLKQPSSKIIFLTAVIWLIVILNLGNYRRLNVIGSDVISYYSYLPALVIEHNLKLSFLADSTFKQPPNSYWNYTLPNGSHVFKMTMGLSFLYAPFFFVAHLFAICTGYEANGFTMPYQFSLCIASWFYAIAGLILLQKLLAQYYKDYAVSTVLVILCFGTNLFYYVSFESALSHAFSFFLFAAMLNLCRSWQNNPSFKTSVFFGLCLGLIMLVRVSNIVVLIVPILYNITNAKGIKLKLHFFKKNLSALLVIVLCVFFVALPQLFYWKYVTGQWFFYSYINEHFYFSNPQIAEILFSFRKGWFIYTPLLLLAFVGMFLMKEKTPDFFWSTLIFVLVNLYVVSSWWNWWYGGSYSMRPLIDSYPILAIPLAACIEKIFSLKIILRRVLTATITILICWNVYTTYQYKRGVIHYDSMTFKAYAVLFTHFHKPDNYEQLISHPNNETAMKNNEHYNWK